MSPLLAIAACAILYPLLEARSSGLHHSRVLRRLVRHRGGDPAGALEHHRGQWITTLPLAATLGALSFTVPENFGVGR